MYLRHLVSVRSRFVFAPFLHGMKVLFAKLDSKTVSLNSRLKEDICVLYLHK